MTGRVPTRLESLDMLRGLAAILVVAGHLRGFVFEPFSSVGDITAIHGVLARGFYFITGLGHQSVILFFALSGFLVGGKAVDDILQRRFSWPHYLLRRVTRLWVVVVPALALTLLFDHLGMTHSISGGYSGRYYDIYISGPRAPEGVSHSLSTLLGNLAFLQTIAVPTYGSNGPMWSLANEFWYYILFPLGGWLIQQRTLRPGTILGVAMLLALIYLLPLDLLAGGLIWVAGAAAAWCSRRTEFASVLQTSAARAAAVGALSLALVLSKIPAAGFGDLGLGLCTAAALPVLAHVPAVGGVYGSTSRALSEISYTLYLTHFPLLALIVFAGFAPTRWPLSLWSIGIYGALMLATIVWAGIVWWLFERHTDNVYSALTSRLLPAR